MIDFTQQLENYDGKPSVNRVLYDKEVVQEDGTKTTVEATREEPLTLRLAAFYSLLGKAELEKSFAHELNNAESMTKRYNLMKRIDANPKAVELSKEEKEIMGTLLPLRYDVVITGQIMNIITTAGA